MLLRLLDEAGVSFMIINISRAVACYASTVLRLAVELSLAPVLLS